MDFVDIYKTLHPKTTKYSFFSSAHGTLYRTDHILGDKSVSTDTKRLRLFPAYFQTTMH